MPSHNECALTNYVCQKESQVKLDRRVTCTCTTKLCMRCASAVCYNKTPLLQNVVLQRKRLCKTVCVDKRSLSKHLQSETLYIPKLQSQFAEFLKDGLLFALVRYTCSPASVVVR